jgi:serine/threonine protein kinase/tetratricopeptide (TPR) repeat protein
MNDESINESRSAESLVAEVADDFMERLHRGERPDIEEYARRHPQIASVLRRVLPALEVIGSESPGWPGSSPASSAELHPEGNLGDFRLVREIGRGGMGVVYQAIQISLGREVALKVLPFAAALDAKQLQRFKNEAQAAAHLHHTHIVPVYGIGCERGVHYYAMQYIEGKTVAAVIAELRQLSGFDAETHKDRDAPAADLTRDFVSGRWAPVRRCEEPPPGSAIVPEIDPPSAETGASASAVGKPPNVGRSTDTSTRKPAYFRTVANLGVQAALGLEHAHALGVIHRDIKPANLIVDNRGNLWITDFGLARLQGGAELTVTGDLVGTLRYMSPEQALAQRIGVDHRTDIYSLGMTLYELVTLEPAFGSRDRSELLQQIAFEDPRRPGLVNPALPTDLETIVLKATEKNPTERYTTAQELADDLQRFLDDKPVRARRPSFFDRAAKWSRRHRTAVSTGAAGLLVASAVLAGSVGWIVRDRAARLTETRHEVVLAVDQARWLRAQGQWADAQAASQRAEGLLAGQGADKNLIRLARGLAADLEEDRRDRRMVARLEEADMAGSRVNVAQHRLSTEQSVPEYEAAFREYGIDWRFTTPKQAREKILGRSLEFRLALIASLDRWESQLAGSSAPDRGQQVWLAEALRAIDPDPWRARIREAVRRKDFQALAELADAPELAEQAPLTLQRLGWLLCERAGRRKLGIAVLRRAQARHVSDFWINGTLGQQLRVATPPERDEAVRFCSVAVALQPKNAGALVNLGNALKDQGHLDEAVACYRKAIDQRDDYADAYSNLGATLQDQGKLDQAIAALRTAIKLRPDLTSAYNNLGSVLQDRGQLDEALAVYLQVVAIKADNANTHNNIGSLLVVQGKLDEATAEFREALKKKPDMVLARLNLAMVLKELGKREAAIGEYRKLIGTNPNLAQAHCYLGLALRDNDEFAAALVHLKRGHELGARNPRWKYPSAEWIAECTRQIALQARLPRVLAGQDAPADTRERVSFGEVCYHKRRFERATAFYEMAMAREPGLADDAGSGLRYSAACCAALAGSGAGRDAGALGDQERAFRRGQARDWLRAELRQRDRNLVNAAPDVRATIARTLQHWLIDSDLAGLREGDYLAKLPRPEREECAKLWADVRELLARAQRP